MPKELLPPRRKHEPNKQADLFPRTSNRVLARPPCDRMLRAGEAGTRREAKQALRQLTGEPHLEHLRD